MSYIDALLSVQKGISGKKMAKITRRSAILSGLTVAGASLGACSRESVDAFKGRASFKHGVASGDPGADRMLIWSRLSVEENAGDPPKSLSIPVTWEMASDRTFAKVRRRGKTQAQAGRDFTLKVDVTKLKPGQTYYYRFTVGDVVSPVGRTKTLPAGTVEKARFAVVSCSNYPFGFFNVYDHISKEGAFDAVIHLGDYFYEYGRDGYGGKVGAKIGREHEPAHEILSLDDYRTRHRQYKSDLAAQAMHAAHPIICIWDDHETANDSWKGGAENHNKGEGGWDARRAAAMQAYYEWMPVRDPVPGHAAEALFAHYEFGDLLTICAIETRLTARSRQVDYGQYIPDLQTREGVGNFIKNILWDPSREMLGAAQSAIVADVLKTSKAKNQPWRIVANQTLMARVASPNLSDYKGEAFLDEVEKLFPQIHDYIALSPLGLPINLDSWDGYPAARERFYELVKSCDVSDLLVLTGDTHEGWANKLVRRNGDNMGVELGTPSVTSPGTGAYFGGKSADFSAKLKAKNDDVVYHNLQDYGYIDLTLTQAQGQAIFIGIDTITQKEYQSFKSKAFEIVREPKTLNLKEI